MSYQQMEFTKPIIDFIKKCPFLQGEEISIITFSPDALLDGNALAYTGTGRATAGYDCGGGVTITKQANFVLYFRRPINDNQYRLEATDFICNFEAWVEYENFMGNPVRIGHTDKERIWADNGSIINVTEDGAMTFAVQIHIEYQVIYRSGISALLE